ncbi:P-loop containing nucleoside triphosphate hydrolase protein [Irpex lacteus]|nr:P-loop containing nucleoside triphosphate hydrolase protein [Irpex lacteus]
MAMTEPATTPPPKKPPVVHVTRGYQQELLQESLRKNIVIALDTGSGKTHIAMLRMKHEVEQQTKKICWFLAPTVALIEQQKDVIASSIPVPVGFISGASEPDQWRDADLWTRVLTSYKIVVSTPQILLDALRHGYISLGAHISLMVFDEAHHATSKHPYNEIMKGSICPSLPPGERSVGYRSPAVLGLTASPIYGGNVEASFKSIEANLDCVIRSSRLNRDEWLPASIGPLLQRINIEDDPYVVSLRSQLAKLQPGEQRNRVDQRLSKTLLKRDTFTHRGFRDLERTAIDLCTELGYWAADWYNGFLAGAGEVVSVRLASQVAVEPVSYEPEDILAEVLRKSTRCQMLAAEERDLPALQDRFRVASLLGTSNSIQRRDFLDITRDFVKKSATQTLKDFRIGDKNLVVATSVAEEGLDIQACGNVIRFNPPENMVSWAQSRGRARKEKSTYIIMFGNDATSVSTVIKWEQLEREMVTLYSDLNRVPEEPQEGETEDTIQLMVESTGALLTLDSAIGHLHHFCSVLPHSGHGPLLPIFDLDPPEMEEGWHSLNPAPGVSRYQGPWGATCILPRQVPAELRRYTVSCVYPSKRSARNHAAFFAYNRLYEHGLLNDHLLPLTSVIEPDEDGAVKLLLQEVEERAGTANVPIQMDPWFVGEGETRWWYNELIIEGLPPLFMFTRNPLPSLEGDELPTLHVPGKGSVQVAIRSTEVELDEDVAIDMATDYTRRMFASLYNPRMEAGKTDFCYTFLPMENSETDVRWKERRQWQKERLSRGNRSRLENLDHANAEALAEEYDYPLDVALVRSNEKYDKLLQFIGWHYGPISEEDEDELTERYDGFPDFELNFPLLYVQSFPKRRNFLIPLESAESGLTRDLPLLLHPKFATIDLIGLEDAQYAFQLPSIYAGSPVSQETVNYQRLETLGDTVLKYVTSINLFSQYPLWHEGYLSRRKDHAVNNNRLAKEAIRLGVEKWIIRDRFVPRKWRPRYADESTLYKGHEEVDADAEGKSTEKPARKKKKQTQHLSTKMLADIVESLIGAAYEHGSFDLGVEAIKLFNLGIETWNTIPNCVETALSQVEHVNDLPPQLALVEDMLGTNSRSRFFS